MRFMSISAGTAILLITTNSRFGEHCQTNAAWRAGCSAVAADKAQFDLVFGRVIEVRQKLKVFEADAQSDGGLWSMSKTGCNKSATLKVTYPQGPCALKSITDWFGDVWRRRSSRAISRAAFSLHHNRKSVISLQSPFTLSAVSLPTNPTRSLPRELPS